MALLPVVSKILERAVFVQFIDYLESNKLMNPSHHGFRSSHSICTALLEMYDVWNEAQAQGKVSATVMLDLSAAFDVVDSFILVEKMKLYGFDESSIQLLSSYLANRSQMVLIDGHLSSARLVTVGFPKARYWARCCI